MRSAIALPAFILAFLQNRRAIASGLVHGAISLVPHRFLGVFVAELLAMTLFSRFSTLPGPVQALTMDFSVVP